MRLRILAILTVAQALAAMTPQAQAGAIRYAGKQVAKGTAVVASAVTRMFCAAR